MRTVPQIETNVVWALNVHRVPMKCGPDLHALTVVDQSHHREVGTQLGMDMPTLIAIEFLEKLLLKNCRPTTIQIDGSTNLDCSQLRTWCNAERIQLCIVPSGTLNLRTCWNPKGTVAIGGAPARKGRSRRGGLRLGQGRATAARLNGRG